MHLDGARIFNACVASGFNFSGFMDDVQGGGSSTDEDGEEQHTRSGPPGKAFT